MNRLRPLAAAAPGLCIAVVLAHPSAAVAAEAGDLDRTFGRAGKVVTRVAGGEVVAKAVTPAPKGGFVVVGHSPRREQPYGGGRLLLLRYDRAGRLVKSFGRSGTAAVTLLEGPATVEAAVRQADGKLVVVGRAGGGIRSSRVSSPTGSSTRASPKAACASSPSARSRAS